MTPPALPRPPAWTCALTTQTGPANRCAAATASSAVAATRPVGTGMPYSAKTLLRLIFVKIHHSIVPGGLNRVANAGRGAGRPRDDGKVPPCKIRRKTRGRRAIRNSPGASSGCSIFTGSRFPRCSLRSRSSRRGRRRSAPRHRRLPLYARGLVRDRRHLHRAPEETLAEPARAGFHPRGLRHHRRRGASRDERRRLSGAGLLLSAGPGVSLLLPPRIATTRSPRSPRSASRASSSCCWFSGLSDSSDLSQAGLLGGVILIAALAVAPLAGRLRESEALVRQRDLDLANLAELSQYIVERLRESLLVVDEQDRIRLINESARRSSAASTANALVGEVSPRLLYLLAMWRQSAPMTDAVGGNLLAVDGAARSPAAFRTARQR